MFVFAIVVASLLLSSVFARTPVGVNIDPSNPQGNPSPSDVAALGATWVRLEYKDSSTGPTPSQSQLAFYDPIVSSFSNAGIQVLMILDYSSLPGKPDWKAPRESFVPYANTWVERIGNVAGHFGRRVSSFEIWNEPDLLRDMGGYDPGIQPDVFGSLFVEPAVNKIKDANPSATTTIGGMASGDPTYVSKMMNAMSNGQFFGTSLSLHPYGQRPTPNWPWPGWGFGNVGDLLNNYKNVIGGIPMIVSEVGTNDMKVQDDFPYHMFTSLDSIRKSGGPVVDVAHWFCWSDGMVSPFGLLASDGSKKPSYASYQNYTAMN